ncbi:hypothetical protein [Paenibacillus sp. FSL K6-2859]|uniref:hypothetical protein n=1 Tax=Paenibacillus sp. FSL K6-2859 TaxID=2921482 RepID=UPI0030F64AED
MTKFEKAVKRTYDYHRLETRPAYSAACPITSALTREIAGSKVRVIRIRLHG